ncbi:MAG: hypothetical protein AB7O59_07085 [Pirellulales bacterium]
MGEPKRYLSFIDTRQFDAAWNELRLTDDDHADLEDRILNAPLQAPVIPGTVGVRKMRYAPPSWNTGRRGALRVCYVCFLDVGTIVLLTVYPKNVKDTLSAADKKAINHAVDIVRNNLR